MLFIRGLGRRQLALFLTSLAFALSMAHLSLAHAAATPGTGLAGTAHDFTTSSSSDRCVACHTPHQTRATTLAWNPTQLPSSFNWDADQTTAGTGLPGSAGHGPSMKCLSCHDGSVAAVGGAAIGTAVNRLGNHPVGIPYPLNGAPGRYNGIQTGDRLAVNDFVSNPNNPSASVKLYSDDGFGKITNGVKAGASGIECGSCHDPHNKVAQDVHFLRGKLAGSSQADGYICMQCHAK